MRLLLPFVSAAAMASSAAGAQATNAPGAVFDFTVGRVNYTDDSGSVARPEYRLQMAYRWCVYCGGALSRVRITAPVLSLAFTDVAGVSLAPPRRAAVSSLDLGAAVSVDVARFGAAAAVGGIRLDLNVANGITRTTERMVPRGSAFEPVNFSGKSGSRSGVQLSFVCTRVPVLGVRTVALGWSQSNGSYRDYESRQTHSATTVAADLASPMRYSSSSVWIGVQSRLLWTDCE